MKKMDIMVYSKEGTTILSVKIVPNKVSYEKKRFSKIFVDTKFKNEDEALRRWYGIYTAQWLGSRVNPMSFFIECNIPFPIIQKNTDIEYEIIGWKFPKVEKVFTELKLIHPDVMEKITEQTENLGKDYCFFPTGKNLYFFDLKEQRVFNYCNGRFFSLKLESSYKDDFSFEEDLDSLFISEKEKITFS